MPNYSLRLPAFTVGKDALSAIRDVIPDHQKAVVIGGKKGINAIRARLEKAAQGAVDILDFLWYGGEASEENIVRLSGEDAVQRADILFAVGGGKALDTCKALGLRIGKPVYAFPTIASTCAACTAVAILYHPDGSFAGPCFLPGPPRHTFIDTEVIASAPERYLWAGLGDTCAKYFEAAVSSRGDELAYYHALGVSVSRSCLEPLLRYGEQAFRDHREKKVTEELTQVILTIIVTTAVASILLTADRIIDYNTGLAHAVFYALTAFPELHLERDHLHGEVVGFGVLILLLADGQEDMFRKMYAFNRSVGLPTGIGEIGITESDLQRVLPKVLSMPDIAHNPYPVTLDMLSGAFRKLQEMNEH
ncbi:MAG: iron-containing alcohol dehydrogenase family protein [Clostridia bacterium]|nr:iron-containing alcohol dehydrogenase family protein [Clostridia bacterium]